MLFLGPETGPGWLSSNNTAPPTRSPSLPHPSKTFAGGAVVSQLTHNSGQVIRPGPEKLPNRHLLKDRIREPGTLVNASCRPVRSLGTRRADSKFQTRPGLTQADQTTPPGLISSSAKSCRLRKWPDYHVSLLYPHLQSFSGSCCPLWTCSYG